MNLIGCTVRAKVSWSQDCLLREKKSECEVSGLSDEDWLTHTRKRDREVPKGLSLLADRIAAWLIKG